EPIAIRAEEQAGVEAARRIDRAVGVLALLGDRSDEQVDRELVGEPREARRDRPVDRLGELDLVELRAEEARVLRRRDQLGAVAPSAPDQALGAGEVRL